MRYSDGSIVKWKKLGEGTFNITYLSEEPFSWNIDGQNYFQRWVMKTRKCDDDLNDTKRAVRLWNLINPNTPAALISEKKSWIAPYMGNTPASDLLIARELIEIYKRTRRVIMDGCGNGNMLLVDDEAFCIDVDQAFGRDSPVSKDGFKDIGYKAFDEYWRRYSRGYGSKPKSINVIRTLHYLEQYLKPFDIQNKYLTETSIKRLNLFRLNKLVISKDDLSMASILSDAEFKHYFSKRQPSPPRLVTKLSKGHPLHHPKPLKAMPKQREAEEENESSWIPSFLRLW